MKCARCDKNLQKDFVFCPYCGERKSVNPFSGFFKMFSRNMSDIDNSDEFSGFDNMSSMENFRIDLGELFKMNQDDFPEGSKEIVKKIPGGSIKIKMFSSNGQPIKRQFIPVRRVNCENTSEESPEEVSRFPVKDEVQKKLNIRPDSVVEPVISLKRRANRLTIEIDIPGVEKEADVHIHELKESIELRAFGKDKTYFKIIKIPQNSKVLDRKFEKGKLTLTII